MVATNSQGTVTRSRCSSHRARYRYYNGADGRLSKRSGMMQGTTPNELQIRALIDERVKAVRDKDARAAVAAIAPGIVIFDVVNPLRRIGSEENEQRAQDWFASFK